MDLYLALNHRIQEKRKMEEDKIKEEFKNFEGEKEEDEEPSTKDSPAMEFLMTYGWAILAAIIAIGVLAYFGVFAPAVEPELNGTIVLGQAYVDFKVLNCDRFLTQNNFTYINRSDVEYISQIIDHVLCVNKDIYEANPRLVKKSMKKYNLGFA